MYRKAIEELAVWKNNPNRKPLIIQGARQVGKTWIMKEFGSKYFKNVVYINFESSVSLQTVFRDDFSVSRLITVFEIESRQKIHANDTLILLDEIQEAEKGLTALKYFQENAPEYFVIAAGSHLGVSLQKNTSFPVGKVDFVHLLPMSFEEFLLNHNEHVMVNAMQAKEWEIMDVFHEKLTQYLRLFYFIGGMPEAVYTYFKTHDLAQVRKIQANILAGYEHDFSKHAPLEIVPKIRLVWQTILSQLSKDNKKFIYGQIKKGARAKEFEAAINWLVNSGLILKSMRVSKPGIPLKSYANMDAFKLYILDVGLLNAMADISEQILLHKNQILVEFKGALTEQFVAQELIAKYPLYYWAAENGSSELDFLIKSNQYLVPVEVKAEENLKSKSLRVFEDKFNTGHATRFSMSKYRKDDWLVNLPLYTVFTL